MRRLILLAIAWAANAAFAQPSDGCGEVVTIATHGDTTMRYAYAPAGPASVANAPVALVMLVGGGGHLNLDDKGCPRLLGRNSLVRMRPLLHDAGFVTALVDAPSDMPGDDGLGGFRLAPQHADDLGRVIADLRARTRGPVWIIGHSRGSISAANAAARLTGEAAPDGVALMSAMMVGDAGKRKSWVAQTVFDAQLDAIKVPVLVIGHAADSCVRSPAALMDRVIARTRGARQQAATVTGGPVGPGRPSSLAACEVREPHDFVDQEALVAAGIARFIRGGSF